MFAVQSLSIPAFVFQDADADGQQTGRNEQGQQGIAGHQVPAFAHELNHGIQSAHNCAHPAAGQNFVEELESVRLVAREVIQHRVEQIDNWIEYQVGPSLAILFRTMESSRSMKDSLSFITWAASLPTLSVRVIWSTKDLEFLPRMTSSTRIRTITSPVVSRLFRKLVCRL